MHIFCISHPHVLMAPTGFAYIVVTHVSELARSAHHSDETDILDLG